MRRLPLLFILLTGAAVVLTAARQSGTGASAPQAVFRSAVDLVHLDVSVLDKARKPIRGLTAADFTILEDGQPRPVAAFAELEAKPAAVTEQGAAPWIQRVAADVQTNSIARTPEGRLFVLLLDDGLTPADPAATATAKEIARVAIERLSPGDQMAVVFTVGSKGAQNFTSDRAKLLAAASTFTPGYARHVMGWDTAMLEPRPSGPPLWRVTMDNDAQYRAAALRTLEMVAESLIAAPQRRKAIIYVSPGVFADTEASEVVAIQPGQSMMLRQANSSLNARLPELFRRMRQANVTIYALDPMGLGGMEAYIQRTAAGLPAAAQALPVSLTADWYSLTAMPLPPYLAHHVASINLDFLKTAAENTGGLAITDTNDLGRGVDRIFDENASYYLLGFVIPPGHRAGSQHRLQVKVARPDLTVRARSGYAVPEQPAADAGTTSSNSKPVASATSLALAGPVPSGPLPMRAAIAPFAPISLDQRDAIVAIALGLEHNVPRDTAQTFEVEVRAFSADGSQKLAERRTGQATLRPAPPGGDAVFDLLARIALPPGRYELRFGASLSPANLTGALFADVEVPDFRRDPVALSGVLLETTEGNAGPLDALAAISPIVPTSQRTFTLRQQPQAFVRVYQGGNGALAPVSLKVTLHDRANELVYNNRFPLAVAKFDPATRSTDFRFRIPVQALSGGPYLLSFETQMGDHIARRQVRFTFR